MRPFRRCFLFRFHRDVAPYLRAHRVQYVIDSFAVLMVVTLRTLLPRLLGRAVDLLSRSEANVRNLSMYALLLGGVALTLALFNLLQCRQMIVASRQIEVIIAHRLSTTLHCDRIGVTRRRQILETGTRTASCWQRAAPTRDSTGRSTARPSPPEPRFGFGSLRPTPEGRSR